MEHQDIAGIEVQRPLLVGHVIVDSERKADQLQLFATAAFEQQRLRLPGIGDAQFARGLAPGGEAESQEAALDAALADQLIELAQKLGGQKFLRRDAAQDADGHGAIKRGGGAFAADVAQAKAEARGTVAQEVVKVAADFARGKDPRGEVHAEVIRGNGPQQGALHALGGV